VRGCADHEISIIRADNGTRCADHEISIILEDNGNRSADKQYAIGRAAYCAPLSVEAQNPNAYLNATSTNSETVITLSACIARVWLFTRSSTPNLDDR
jgi:hypothetical protein